MKISEYTVISALNGDDYVLVDGTTGGTRRIPAANLVLSGLNMHSPYTRRTIFRGDNLGSSFTTAQKTAIQNGTFENLWLGDYWEIGGVKYRIADFDYWYGCGDTKFQNHHLVIIPDTDLYSAKMNTTSITTGGYIGSEMYTANLDNAKTLINNAFGESVLTHREFLTSTVSNGAPSAGTWMNSSVELPNEIMIYGCHIYAPANTGTTDVKRYTISTTQLALFRACPIYIPTASGFWLRDVVSGSHFARVDSYGGATSTGAANSYGVRPVFPIG